MVMADSMMCPGDNMYQRLQSRLNRAQTRDPDNPLWEHYRALLQRASTEADYRTVSGILDAHDPQGMI